MNNLKVKPVYKCNGTTPRVDSKSDQFSRSADLVSFDHVTWVLNYLYRGLFQWEPLTKGWWVGQHSNKQNTGVIKHLYGLHSSVCMHTMDRDQ